LQQKSIIFSTQTEEYRKLNKILYNLKIMEEEFCICQGLSRGTMVECANENCKIKWFHLRCLKISEKKQKRLIIFAKYALVRYHHR
jgi:hypothetical protein